MPSSGQKSIGHPRRYQANADPHSIPGVRQGLFAKPLTKGISVQPPPSVSGSGYHGLTRPGRRGDGVVGLMGVRFGGRGATAGCLADCRQPADRPEWPVSRHCGHRWRRLDRPRGVVRRHCPDAARSISTPSFLPIHTGVAFAQAGELPGCDRHVSGCPTRISESPFRHSVATSSVWSRRPASGCGKVGNLPQRLPIDALIDV